MNLLSFTTKWLGAGRSILIFKKMSLIATLSLPSQSTVSFARNVCKRNCRSWNYFKQINVQVLEIIIQKSSLNASRHYLGFTINHSRSFRTALVDLT